MSTYTFHKVSDREINEARDVMREHLEEHVERVSSGKLANAQVAREDAKRRAGDLYAKLPRAMKTNDPKMDRAYIAGFIESSASNKLMDRGSRLFMGEESDRMALAILEGLNSRHVASERARQPQIGLRVALQSGDRMLQITVGKTAAHDRGVSIVD